MSLLATDFALLSAHHSFLHGDLYAQPFQKVRFKLIHVTKTRRLCHTNSGNMYGKRINEDIYTFPSLKAGLLSLAQGHDKEHPESRVYDGDRTDQNGVIF